MATGSGGGNESTATLPFLVPIGYRHNSSSGLSQGGPTCDGRTGGPRAANAAGGTESGRGRHRESFAMLKLLIADDHSVVRRGLRQILEETPDIEVGDEAVDGNEVLEKVRGGSWDALVLDITMPGRNGLDILKEVKAEYPLLPVLILSMHAQEQFAARVLKAGASGYLPKESAPEELVKAVRKICAGGRYITTEQAENIVSHFNSGGDRPPHELLSDREYEVLRMIASGKPVSQIALEIKLSVKTVSTYRARLLEKMAMKNNAELTHYAIKNALVS